MSPRVDDTLLARLNSKDGKQSITAHPKSEVKYASKMDSIMRPPQSFNQQNLQKRLASGEKQQRAVTLFPLSTQIGQQIPSDYTKTRQGDKFNALQSDFINRINNQSAVVGSDIETKTHQLTSNRDNHTNKVI